MGFPMYIPVGWASLYGMGSEIGVSGLVPDNTKFKFAVIYGLGNGDGPDAAVGDSVMFKEDDVICRLAWDNWPYTMIERAKLAGTEIPPV